MHWRSRFPTLLILAVALMLVAPACNGYGNVGTVSHTVDAQGARSANALFTIGSGAINVDGGADPLMQATFTVNNRRIPNVSYQLNDGIGAINISQSSQSSRFIIGPVTNHWDIVLNDDIPLGLKIVSQSARSTLALDTLTVESLDFSTSSGDATIGLSGVQSRLNDVTLRSASGDLRLTMGGDYSKSATLEVNSSSGSVNAELSGEWTAAMDGKFQSGSGAITITVPKHLGVRVTAETDSGSVNVRGLTSQGRGVYTLNSSQPVMLNLSVATSSGNITLRTSG